jgi:hypothetical protein
VWSQSFNAASIHVCQLSPVARKACITLGEKWMAANIFGDPVLRNFFGLVALTKDGLLNPTFLRISHNGQVIKN